FCRDVDDIADEDRPRPERLALLSVWRQNIDGLYAGHVAGGLEDLARAISHFGLHKEDFLTVIDGVESDARADLQPTPLKELSLYCDQVASPIGRLNVLVFGMKEA